MGGVSVKSLLSLCAAGLLLPAPAFAQDVSLGVHLRSLAQNPRSLPALLGAGRAALEGGDVNAALGFFARATQVDPRNGRAKAGLGTALVMVERADEALRAFAEAEELGVPETEFVKDRGLAYDLRGDNKRAQRDYVLALRRGPDDEVTRRLALSYAIGGDRASALALLDPLLRRQDQGAWRARAFVLAMTGDVSGASRVAGQVMPAAMAQSLQPFLARLPSLNPAERARAVNFGTMPMGARTPVQLGDPYQGRTTVAARQPEPRVAAVDVKRVPPWDRPSAWVASSAPPPPPPPPSAPTPVTRSEPLPEPPVVQKAPAPSPAPSRLVAPSAAPRLAGLLAGIAQETETQPVSLPDPALLRAERLAQAKREAEAKAVADAKLMATRKAAEAKTAAAKKAAVEKAAADKKLLAEREAKKKNPARVWVQVASGPNESALPFTWNKLKKQHEPLAKRTPYAMPFGRTNRLLVGPMKSAADAKTLVNALSKDGLKATTFSSEPGQEIAKLAAK